ncbi:elongation factor G [Marinobacterium arenosum]|uniref:elongation factor G n=1 Tax=Marinobacterium arenosum TaxID=2862496 RepID=UPI001C954C5D|nr:elongation factor G [Marinobacterium arenosum]MBY4677245.1 elongation factor G [Marinobacterium arenosum]
MDSNTVELERVRNIGIIAHIDAGKTTTTERVLYYTGRTHRLGSVDDGTTVTDWMIQERERGITIVSAVITASWRDHQINLIDTPGHIDFTAEVQRALRVLDGGIVVFDAVHGVEPQSETVWRQADRYRVPRICFVNKMDRLGADFDFAVETIEQRLGARTLLLQLPIGAEAEFEGVIDLLRMQAIRWPDELGASPEIGDIPPQLQARAEQARSQLLERVVETDDSLLELYLEGEEPDADALIGALRRATIANRLFPVLCGASLRNKGIQPLLDAVVDLLPSPLDIGAVSGTDPRSEQPAERPPSEDAPLAALVFKVVSDPYVGHLAYFRVYSGRMRPGDKVYNATRDKNERVGRMVRMYADHREAIEQVSTGDIDAVLGMKSVHTGDTLCDPAHPILLESIQFPEPVINIALEPRTHEEEKQIGEALHHLAEEDPTFKVFTDEETGQTILAGMGELHLQIVVDRLEREHQLKVKTGKPRVSYKETVSQPVAGIEGRHVKQTGGHGQYGHVVLDLAPAAPGSGICIDNQISGGAIPREFIPAVEKGIHEAARSGVLGGYAITDLQVTLRDGSSHEVDSSEQAFRSAGAKALIAAVREAEPILLEPICRLEVVTPEEYTGDVLGQLSARRGEIEGMTPRAGGVEVIRGQVPLREMFGYATQLRSITQGRALFSMEFDHYASLPPELKQEVLARG